MLGNIVEFVCVAIIAAVLPIQAITDPLGLFSLHNNSATLRRNPPNLLFRDDPPPSQKIGWFESLTNRSVEYPSNTSMEIRESSQAEVYNDMVSPVSEATLWTYSDGAINVGFEAGGSYSEPSILTIQSAPPTYTPVSAA